eukprot:s1339_g10.t2
MLELEQSSATNVIGITIGYAFAQSVKLAVFETIVDASIEKAKPIPEALAQYGTFDMDEKLVKMQMGAIFVTKCSLTLQTDMLGTPEILWEHDQFDAQYEACRKYLEVGKRVEILDQRLAVLNDLYSFLQTQLEVKHSNKLEWIVIVLIVIEILLDLFHMSPFYTQRSVAICALLLIAGGSVAVAKEVKPSKLWRSTSRQSSRLWRAALMTLLVLIAWRAPRTKPTTLPTTLFVGGHVVPSGPGQKGTQSTSRYARSAVSGRQVWQILPDAERRWLLLGMVGLLGSSCLQLLAPPLVSAALMAAEKGAKAAQVKLLAVVVRGLRPRFGMQSECRDYNMAMSACEKGSQWLLALRLFSNMQMAASEPNLASYSILMTLWGRASHWHHAFQVFADLCGRPSFLVDVVCFASMISCCECTSRWQKSMELFQEMQEQRVKANIICYSALISSFEKGFQWQFSMAAFHQMEMSQLVPDVICYSALLSSFEKGSQWQWSLHFFQVMSIKKVRPNTISYHAAISGAEKAGKWQLAQHFFVAMRTQVLQQNVVSCNVSSMKALTSAYEKCHEWPRAIRVISAVARRTLRPNGVTLNALLSSMEGWTMALQCFTWRWGEVAEEKGAVKADGEI